MKTIDLKCFCESGMKYSNYLMGHILYQMLKTVLSILKIVFTRIKGNQTMKFGQLTEHRKRNIFLQKLGRK